MYVLVVNAGSSSLKYQLFNMATEQTLAKGICERIGISGSKIIHKGEASTERLIDMPTHNEAISIVLKMLVDKDYGVISRMDDILAVGHRVVHGGEQFPDSVIADDTTIPGMKENISLAPLHNPPNIMGIEACAKAMPHAPQVAVFDTSFHSTIPEYAFMYAIPYEDYKQLKIRRYGFHGTSHKYVSEETIKHLGLKKSRIVTCHLGNGASVAAVKDGKCIDTSMGLTPLEGLIMGTRSGDIDPALVEYLIDKKGFTAKQATDYLNKKCGVMGVSGVSSDFRDLTAAMQAGNARAKLAVEMFAYRVRKYIGAYAFAMGGLDCVVFTGGIGENTREVRELVLTGLDDLGIIFDKVLNENVTRGEIFRISGGKSKVQVLIVPTNEELVIARETLTLSREGKNV